MASVFFVEYGCYSDAGVDSVWSTRELAEKRIEQMKAAPDRYSDGDERVTEWYVDRVSPDMRPLWRVQFDGKGEVTVTAITEPQAGPVTGGSFFVQPDFKWQPFGNGTICVHADTAEAAIKVASERRAACIAQPWAKGMPSWRDA